MSKMRLCGAACHNAHRLTCNCWCDGLFHGPRGAAARKVFREMVGILPTKVEDGDSNPEALEAARKAYDAAN